MLSKVKCEKCQMIFDVGLEQICPGKPVKHCICCGSSDLTFLGVEENTKRIVRQEDIRDVFDVVQKVLVRSGTEWRTREILAITVLRHDANCPNCGMPLLGEPRFWFKNHSNLSLEDIIAKEDIDPEPRSYPTLGRRTVISFGEDKEIEGEKHS